MAGMAWTGTVRDYGCRVVQEACMGVGRMVFGE